MRHRRVPRERRRPSLVGADLQDHLRPAAAGPADRRHRHPRRPRAGPAPDRPQRMVRPPGPARAAGTRGRGTAHGADPRSAADALPATSPAPRTSFAHSGACTSPAAHRRPGCSSSSTTTNEHVRAWAVRLLVDDRAPAEAAARAFAARAPGERSGLVLLYLASALQKLPLADRWAIAEALAARAEFADDPALPLMIWYGIEPAVPENSARAVALAGSSRMPLLSRFLARRLTEDLKPAPEPGRPTGRAGGTVGQRRTAPRHLDGHGRGASGLAEGPAAGVVGFRPGRTGRQPGRDDRPPRPRAVGRLRRRPGRDRAARNRGRQGRRPRRPPRRDPDHGRGASRERRAAPERPAGRPRPRAPTRSAAWPPSTIPAPPASCSGGSAACGPRPAPRRSSP